jgi:glycosyltransferase involved in cell wall biosynthesis
MNTLKISVVIGAFNQREILQRTLESYFRQTLSPEQYEIQLVDSFSSDGTDKMVEQLCPTCPFNYLRVENRGKTAARNRGIKSSRGEIILLTDADMVAEPALLEEHLRAHEKRDNASFEGLTINPDGKPYIRTRLKPRQRLKWAYFLSGNLSVRKQTLLDAGLFDENFRDYGWEDLELGYRLHQMKVPLFYLPSAVNHHHHYVAGAGMAERKYAMGKSAALFYKKHPRLEIKLFLGINPLAMGIYHFLKHHPTLLDRINSRYIQEEYQYRRGWEEGMRHA